MEWRLESEAGLEEVVNAVLAKLKEYPDSAAILALHGDLGAGKTTFIQKLAKTLGVTETVTSPTFVIMKSYELLDQAWEELIHIDAYRIEEVDEMRPLGFDTIIYEKGNIVCIEWAEKIAELLPAHTLHLTIEIDGESRNIKLDA